jgi:hypothetical protein
MANNFEIDRLLGLLQTVPDGTNQGGADATAALNSLRNTIKGVVVSMAEDFETTAPVGLTPAPVGMTRSGVRVNPDGSISRGLGPEPTAQTTAPVPAPAPETVPAPSLQLNIEPVVFDKPEMDAFTRMFQTASGGPSAVIAREVAGQVAIGNEEFFSYRQPSRWNGAPV